MLHFVILYLFYIQNNQNTENKNICFFLFFLSCTLYAFMRSNGSTFGPSSESWFCSSVRTVSSMLRSRGQQENWSKSWSMTIKTLFCQQQWNKCQVNIWKPYGDSISCFWPEFLSQSLWECWGEKLICWHVYIWITDQICLYVLVYDRGDREWWN